MKRVATKTNTVKDFAKIFENFWKKNSARNIRILFFPSVILGFPPVITLGLLSLEEASVSEQQPVMQKCKT